MVDPNVLISAFNRLDGNPRRVVEDIVNERVVMAATETTLEEVRRALEKPYFSARSTAQDRTAYLQLIACHAELYDDRELQEAITRDPKDDYLVQLCREAGAEMLVSGDPDLTTAKLTGVRVITPAEYVRERDRDDGGCEN